MFYERIYSSSEFNRYERIWLLKILSCGMMNDNVRISSNLRL
jgi:hypothetical protein